MIINNELVPFKLDILDSELSMLLYHIHILLNNFTLDSLRPFHLFLKNPSQFTKSFLPSIPNDEIFETFTQINQTEPLKFYNCKCGYTYTIGECTRPASIGICPKCKEQIGGQGHVLVAGNKLLENLNEKFYNGYVLSDDFENTTPRSVRNMGILNTCILRLILDCTMYLSSFKSIEDAIKVLNASMKEDLGEILLKQIKQQIKTLAKCLQHSPDETLLFVHFLLNQLKTCKHRNPLNFDGYLKTKEDRVKYEDFFCNTIIKGIISNDSTDKLIQKCTNVLANDTKNSETDQLFRIAYDLLEFKHENDSSFLMQKKCWSFRKQISVESMISTFNSIISIEKRSTDLMLLNEFISKINELKALKYLPSICKMLNLLYVIFNRQMDKNTASSFKISDLIQIQSRQNDLSFKEIIKTGLKSFMNAWEIISPNFVNQTSLKNKLKIKDIDEFESLPLSYLLSNTSNNGVYIYSLVSYLIKLHNEFVEIYINFRSIKNKEENKVEFESLTSDDCIIFSIEKEILQIVYMHSNYSLESVQEANLEYNFTKIQQTIENRFLLDKPFVNNKVQFFFFFSEQPRYLFSVIKVLK